MNLKIKKNTPTAKLPTRATEGSAGIDLYSDTVILNPNFKTITVDTGISVSFPRGWVMMLYPRSGLATKHGLSLANGVGVVDSDYRGPLKLVFNIGHGSLVDAMDHLKSGNRVAQAVMHVIPEYEIEEVLELDDTIRGSGGFGSSGSE